MAEAVIAALITGTAAATGASIGLGVSLTAALTYGAITAGLSLITTLLLRSPNVSVGSSRGTARQTVRAAVVPRRHAMGRVRGAGFLIFIHEDGDDLHMALLLADGACDGIERVWSDGTEVEFITANISQADGGGRRLSGSGDYADRITIYEYFDGNGLQGKALRDATSAWDTSNQLNGRSWVYVKLNQPKYGNDLDDRFWSRLPNLEFLIRGEKITWPGQMTPTWTRNAAVWRYWHDTVRMGRPSSIIDSASLLSAIAVCDQDITLTLPQEYVDEGWETQVKRYSVDGWLYEDSQPIIVEEEMDFAWEGFVVTFGGQLFYRPGVEPTVAAVIHGDDVIIERYEFLPEPPINQRTNTLTGQIAQSSQHDYTEYSLPEIQDSGAVARDGQVLQQNFGARELVADPIVAARNTTIELRRNQAALVVSYRISPGDTLAYLDLKPGDVITWSDSYYDISLLNFRISSIDFLPDWSLRITMQFMASWSV